MVIHDDRVLISRDKSNNSLNYTRLTDVTPVQKQAGRNKDEYEQ